MPWDMRRVFDALPKPFLIYSWIRLGVPPAVAEYMVNMDVGGCTVVRSPSALKVWSNEGIAELRLKELDLILPPFRPRAVI